MWLFWIALFVIFFLFLQSFYSFSSYEKFTNENTSSIVTFMNPHETQQMIRNDNDGYFQSFSIYDYMARGIQNRDDYETQIQKGLVEWNEKDKERLQKLTKQVDVSLQKIQKPYFSGIRASHIPWKFGFTKGKFYEDGLPHTRGKDIIMVSDTVLDKDDKDLKGTLLHEKVHLYQKLYPEEMDIYLQNNKMRRWRRREVDDRIRANPDTDEYIYKEMNGKEMKSVYEERPNGLEDVKTYPENEQSSEHPYERMAIEIEKEI
jgi:hypothetical protein